VDQRAVASTEVASEQGAESNQESQFGGCGDNETASDKGERVKVGAAAALVGISYDFGMSTITRTQIGSLESYRRNFPKRYDRPPGGESVPNPRPDEAVVFEDFFTAGLHMPPHPVLVVILRKFRVQLHQLMSNAIVQIEKFIWAVTSCGGCPTADVFTHHYELHYQNKKVRLQGSETTLTAQFSCMSFRPSRFGNRVKLAPVMRNKWTSGWDDN
jgi:hypothetical protein